MSERKPYFKIRDRERTSMAVQMEDKSKLKAAMAAVGPFLKPGSQIDGMDASGYVISTYLTIEEAPPVKEQDRRPYLQIMTFGGGKALASLGKVPVESIREGHRLMTVLSDMAKPGHVIRLWSPESMVREFCVQQIDDTESTRACHEAKEIDRTIWAGLDKRVKDLEAFKAVHGSSLNDTNQRFSQARRDLTNVDLRLSKIEKQINLPGEMTVLERLADEPPDYGGSLGRWLFGISALWLVALFIYGAATGTL